jgi:small-conductance mechanosensitive channel
MTLPDWMQTSFFGNSLADWSRAMAGAVVVTLAFALLRGTVAQRLAKLAERTDSTANHAIVELIRSIRNGYVFVAVLGLAVYSPDLRYDDVKWMLWALGLVAFLQGIRSGNRLITFWLARYAARRGPVDRTTLTALGYGLRALLWFVVILTGLDIAGFQWKTLLAGLGIGGIAVALALQNVLGDLFGAVSIVLDKPFVEGDSIAVDDLEGTVEHIGLKTTRVRSVNGEQLVFSNADLLKSRLHNFSRRKGRRLVFTISLSPRTPAEKLARVPSIITDVLAAEPRAALQQSHVIGTGPLGFEVQTSILIPNAEHTLDVRQAILLEVYARLEREGIALASSVAAVAQPVPPIA